VSAVEDVQRGSGGIVCLMGEAGLGKSRLIRELQKTQAEFQITDTSDQDLPSGSRWFETASLSYETAQPYSLFRRLIRRIIGISHTDSQAEVREKLELLTGVLPANSSTSPQSVFETLFGLDDDEGSPPLQGEAFKRALFEVMPALWRQRFSGLPVVIVCDDLHWTDPASIALLHELLPLTDEMAILFVCVFRPERDVPGWKIRNTADETYHHRYTEINLHPLSESQSNEMIDALLGDPDLPVELRSRVLERAEGNPFYIEEVIRTLIDGEALIPGERTNGHIRWRVAGDSADIHIPDNLQALLTARIDGLTEEVRQTLQAASVIGRNFYRRVLKMIDDTSDEFDSHIQTLLRQEMIRESARVPEIEYRFRNPLTQEAAYRTILLKRRRKFHQRVGEVMESLFSEQLDEQAPQLAYHFREAHKFERAMDHFARAGDVAYRLFANEEAATHYGEALAMARKSKETISTETLLHLYLRRGRALEHLVATEAAMENYQEMLAHSQENGEQKMALSALMAMATLFSTQTAVQDVDRARELSEEALDLASSLEEKAAEATIYWNLMNTIAFADGDMDQGLAYGETSLKIARELDLKEQTAFTLNSMIMIYWKNNLLAQGIALLDEVRDLWRELDNQPMLADSYMMSGFIQLMKGDYRSALETFLELERISLAINNAWNLSAGRLFLGLCYVEMGEIDEGFSYLNKTIEVSDKPGLFGNELLAKVILAGGYSILGMVDQATLLAEETMRRIEDVRDYDQPLMFGLACAAFIRSGALPRAKVIFEEISKHDVADGNAWFVAYIVGAEAEFALAEGRPEEAIEHIEKHLGKLYEFGVLAPLPYLLYLRSQAESRLGDNQSSKASLEQALEASNQNGERLWRWQILASLASVADSDGSQDVAEWREQASETIDFIANNIGDPDLHQAFLARPNISAHLETKIAK
ncbi:MAG TPA: AAA family ATPase, partial [candidate division Zixibacteria bacterium]|nr:AAA family ATPase [candidate division Zixibacteria bacterium]